MLKCLLILNKSEYILLFLFGFHLKLDMNRIVINIHDMIIYFPAVCIKGKRTSLILVQIMHKKFKLNQEPGVIFFRIKLILHRLTLYNLL